MNTDAYGQIPIFAFVAFIGLGASRLKAQQQSLPFGRVFFAVHLLCLSATLVFTLSARWGMAWVLFDPFNYTKSAIYVLGTLLLALALVPIQGWSRAVRSTGRLWLYSLSIAGFGWYLGSLIKALWRMTSTPESGWVQTATLDAVRWGLGFFIHDLMLDPPTYAIGTTRYMVEIAPGCSGVEGLGLVLLFTSIWLWFFRKGLRFPQALLLIPCALGCSWLLNIVRLCILIIIANAGGGEVAQAGFHAEAGWISFITISLIFTIAIQKIPWMRRAPSAALNPAEVQPAGSVTASEQGGESPAIRFYLIPFLAILAATAVSRAASGSFEWLYPLRFFAAVAALLFFWPEMKKLNWRFGWIGPLAGVFVFLVWIAPSWWAHNPAPNSLGVALAGLSPLTRWSWIAFRVAAAVLTVPIAEELAFRGYLARRFVSRDFDLVSFSSLTALSIALSSIAFGLMHGQHWLVGIIAGLAFACVLRWRGRFGDAVVAHAVANLLLAAWVLGFGQWSQW
jgi:exosortase E/protease (VPEID-CTERM system)